LSRTAFKASIIATARLLERGLDRCSTHGRIASR
jgi:hypothetical protein